MLPCGAIGISLGYTLSSLFELDFMTGFFMPLLDLTIYFFYYFSPMFSSKQMKKIKIEDQLKHALRNDKDSWIHAWQINHAKKTELNKLEGQKKKIILAIDGKKDGHQKRIVKSIVKIEFNG